MSNYPDGMSSDYFDQVTGGGKYEPDWCYKESVDAEVVGERVDNILLLIKQNNIGKAKEALEELAALCMYDANPNNGE